MKTDKRHGSVFTLLLRNYILFTLLLVLILGVFVAVSLYRFLGIMVNVDPAQIKECEEALSTENYNKFPSERLLGAKGFIIVLNNNQEIIYKGGNLKGLNSLSREDIICIPDYIKSPVISTQEFSNDQGKALIAVTIQETVNNVEGFKTYILDANRNIIYQSDDLPMSVLTKLQYELLSDSYDPEYSLGKYNFKTKDGEERVALLVADRNVATNAVGKAWGSFFFIFVTLYVVMVLFFVLWLKRGIQKPLGLLCNELNNYGKGAERQTSYKGPREFVEIFDSFDAMAERLSYSEEERARLETAKQKMLADIAHDLKTPITVIQGYAKALNDDVVPQEDKELYLKTMEKKAESLNELINTFYEYSKMEHPSYTFDLIECDICNYLRDYVADRYEGLELAGNLIEADIPEVHIRAMVDKVHLGRAFDNIVNNAVKHNPIGTTLFFKLEQLERHVRITIGDNGIGISPEIRNTVFEPFVVGEASRGNNGSGLGLSITKKIIKAHYGRVRLIEPKPPYSTAYEIMLPTI